MARLQKDVVNYFPHDANACSGDTLTVLQGRFGNDGYAFWFKLLEKLASTEGHYLDCRNSTKWQLLLAKTGVDEMTGVEIMNLLVEMHAIDKELWESKLIWCQKLVDNVSEVYKNRRREVPQKPVITEINAISTGRNCITCGKTIVDMRSDAKYCSASCRQKANRATDSRDTKTAQSGITTQSNPITMGGNPITTAQSTQSKVKESKVNNIYIDIFNHWNDQKVFIHKKLTADLQRVIKTKLQDYSAADLMTAITNYAEIVHAQEYYWKHKWTLKDFLNRGIDKFLDAEVARENYRTKGEGNGAHKHSARGYHERVPERYPRPEEIYRDP